MEFLVLFLPIGLFAIHGEAAGCSKSEAVGNTTTQRGREGRAKVSEGFRDSPNSGREEGVRESSRPRREEGV